MKAGLIGIENIEGLEWQLGPRVTEAEAAASPRRNPPQQYCTIHDKCVPCAEEALVDDTLTIRLSSWLLSRSTDTTWERTHKESTQRPSWYTLNFNRSSPHQTSTKWTSELSKRSAKELDAVGIEPTTFHMIVDAKRLYRMLVILFGVKLDSNELTYKSYPWKLLVGVLEVACYRWDIDVLPRPSALSMKRWLVT